MFLSRKSWLGNPACCPCECTQEVHCDLPSSNVEAVFAFLWYYSPRLGVLSSRCLPCALKIHRYEALFLSNPTLTDICYSDISISSLDLTFCQCNAKSILAVSPVAYVKDMELRGSLFEDGCTTGAVSCVFTNFYVNHNEPLEALAAYKAGGRWVLGELLEGHEFLIILPVQKPVALPDVFQ
jgi:hypothetical protein